MTKTDKDKEGSRGVRCERGLKNESRMKVSLSRTTHKTNLFAQKRGMLAVALG